MFEFTKRRNLLWLVIAALMISSLASALIAPSVLRAQNEADTACSGIQAAGGDCGSGETQINSVVQSAIEILLFIVGVASVIALIVGGLRYILSGGDQQAVSSAKNTVFYAIIGLVVAVLAYAAVRFVFDAL